MTEVTLVSEQKRMLQEVQNQLLACPFLQQLYYTTGSFDLLVISSVPDMHCYKALTPELFFASSNVARFSTSVAMKTLKQSLKIALDAAAP